MRPLRTFKIEPSLPEELNGLIRMAYNVRWSWWGEERELFRRLGGPLWESTSHNPVAILGQMDQDRLREVVKDPGFMAQYRRVYSEWQEYLAKGAWWSSNYGEDRTPRVAYFCAEFGLTECIPIYSGGLGVLAGDHLKSASDLGVPLVAIGLLYQQGYFRQRLNADGWQLELYPRNDFHNMPVMPVMRDGKNVVIDIDFPGRKVHVRVWSVQVGRITLYLLDTNVPENTPEDRQFTAQLYGGDQEMRICQEIILGIGGVRALTALGIEPEVFHMNEGHSAFLGLERIRMLMQTKQASFRTAQEAVIASSVFTTHTPVPAGNDAFEAWLIDRYFGQYWGQLGLNREQFLGLGRQDPANAEEPMSLTVLALHMSSSRNGVSKLHGQVSRKLWSGVWPGLPIEEVPIKSVTNGVHTPTWISFDLANLYDRYLGPEWQEKSTDERTWAGINQIPDIELWRMHERRRERLVSFARARLREQFTRRGASASELAGAEEVLDPEALTIGFARRFATYKRANLLLQDLQRLSRLLGDTKRPVQIIFAGKAHPRDNPGKDLIRQIVHICRKPEFRRNLVFIEDYDLNVARYLVQGVDVWLNTPLRPMEASGTSGMKAAANGVLNVSVLDGWWAEGYESDAGWAIGSGETYEDLDYQNVVESQALYDLLEKEVVPKFYDRSADGLPRQWTTKMKGSMRLLTPVFNTNRMVREYCQTFYVPCMTRWRELTGEKLTGAKNLADWKQWVSSSFGQVRVESVTDSVDGVTSVGKPMKVEATVVLGQVKPQDVSVQLYYGQLDADGQLQHGQAVEMATDGTPAGDGRFRYSAEMPCNRTGLAGYTVRVLPRHAAMPDGREMGLIRWA